MTLLCYNFKKFTYKYIKPRQYIRQKEAPNNSININYMADEYIKEIRAET